MNSEFKDRQPIPRSKEPEIVSKDTAREIDLRLNNLEKLYDMVKDVSETAAESLDKYLEQKAGSEERAHKLEDRQHRRASWVVGYVITIIFALSVVSLLKEQFDLVKLILTSSFAVAAGAGLTTVLRRSKGK